MLTASQGLGLVRGLMLTASVVVGTAVVASTAMVGSAPVETVQPAATPDPGTYKPLAKDPFQLVSTSIFKMGNSAFQTHARWGIINKDMGHTAVNRTPDQIAVDVDHKHLTITRDPKNVSDVIVGWTGDGGSASHESTIQSIPGGFAARALDGGPNIVLHQLPNGQLQADASGIVPGTAHLSMSPIG